MTVYGFQPGEQHVILQVKFFSGKKAAVGFRNAYLGQPSLHVICSTSDAYMQRVKLAQTLILFMFDHHFALRNLHAVATSGRLGMGGRMESTGCIYSTRWAILSIT